MPRPNDVKIKITRGTVCDGAPVDAGQVVQTDPKTALLLIGMQKAVPVATTAKKPTEKDTETAAGLTTRNAGDLVSKQ